ncbi:hypothetical protein ICU_05174 [Bacillus cereus BAG2X1-1]|nr:hypothetical protein ICU_05174 [Bacillus cereus BAG2X1-1]
MEQIVECEVCGGSGFSGQGTGYDSVCDNCGGIGEHPNWNGDEEQMEQVQHGTFEVTQLLTEAKETEENGN